MPGPCLSAPSLWAPTPMLPISLLLFLLVQPEALTEIMTKTYVMSKLVYTIVSVILATV